MPRVPPRPLQTPLLLLFRHPLHLLLATAAAKWKGLWRPFDVVAAAALAGPSVRVCAVESSKQAKLGINFSRASCAWNIHVYVTCGFSSQSNTTDCRTLLTPLVRFQVEMEANAVGDFVGGIGR